MARNETTSHQQPPSALEAQLIATLITPKRAATRQRLMAAASAIIAERGLHGATVEDISEAAGFTRGAFYSNFADKEELFSALLLAKQQELLTRIGRAITDDQPLTGPGDAMDQLIAKVLAVLPMDRESHLVHAEFDLFAIRSPGAAQGLVEAAERFRGELGRLIDAGLALAGRRLTVPSPDAVTAVIAIFELGKRQCLVYESAGADPAGLPGNTLALLIRALTEPVRSR